MISHKKRPKGSVIAAIDIGSAKTACFIAHVIDDNGTAEVIGIGHVASKGVKSGIIIDLKETEQSVKQAVNAAETMAARVMKGYPLRDVVMSIPSTYTKSSRASASMKIYGQSITEDDVLAALLRLEEQELDEHHAIIHSIPVAYQVDGHAGVENPIGMHAESLNIDMHCVKAEIGALKNVISVAEKNHLDVDCLCIAPYAAGMASLVNDERDMGCLVIDMGAGVTSYAIFYNGAMIHAGAIPVGGMHVTNDLAAGLNTSFVDAERLKVLYGSCASALSDANAVIDVPTLGEDSHVHDHQVPRSRLVNIIRPRLEELFELIRGDIDINGMDAYTGGRVVLTGGACQLAGVRDLVGLMLNKQVRIGKPFAMNGLAESTSGSEFAKTVGLIHYACERMDEQPRLEEGGSDLPLWPRLKLWFRENW
jgi:cell division protein FtsA